MRGRQRVDLWEMFVIAVLRSVHLRATRFGGRPSPEFDSWLAIRSSPKVSEGWSGKRDSNPRLRPWQGRTLPLSYSRPRQNSSVPQRSKLEQAAFGRAAPSPFAGIEVKRFGDCTQVGPAKAGHYVLRRSRSG